jgi:hypothetical protein
MQFKQCGPEDQICCLDEDNDVNDSSSSEYADSDSFTSTAAESLTYEVDNTISRSSQTPQRRPGPRVPLALQAVYLESCKGLTGDELPFQLQIPVYISER